MITHLQSIDIKALKERAVTKCYTQGRRARRMLAILVRDKFKCVTCNRTTNLTISHTKHLGKSSRNPSIYTLDNCRTLCVECHLLVDRQVYLEKL